MYKSNTTITDEISTSDRLLTGVKRFKKKNNGQGYKALAIISQRQDPTLDYSADRSHRIQSIRGTGRCYLLGHFPFLRRSFCTNEFLAGTPVELIMKISSDRSLKDFYGYIKVTPDQAAFQIEKIWKEREVMAAI